MKRIIVLPFKDGDVNDGLRRLIALNPDSMVVLPMIGLPKFTKSAMKAIKEANAKYHVFFTEDDENGTDSVLLKAEDLTICANPIREILREVTSEDVLALVWDDSLEAHMALHAVEDFAIETWNIEDGLEVIEVDFDEEEDSDALYEAMQESFSVFIESFSEYIMHGVLQSLAKAVQEHIKDEEGKREIRPFDDK